MSSGGDFPNPMKVEKPYRKFGFCLFGALIAGATVVTVLSVWSVRQNVGPDVLICTCEAWHRQLETFCINVGMPAQEAGTFLV
jgi:hypothetical protein